MDLTNRKFVVVERVLGYIYYRVLVQLGFGLARAWLALAWLGWAVTISRKPPPTSNTPNGQLVLEALTSVQ